MGLKSFGASKESFPIGSQRARGVWGRRRRRAQKTETKRRPLARVEDKTKGGNKRERGKSGIAGGQRGARSFGRTGIVSVRRGDASPRGLHGREKTKFPGLGPGSFSSPGESLRAFRRHERPRRTGLGALASRLGGECRRGRVSVGGLLCLGRRRGLGGAPGVLHRGLRVREALGRRAAASPPSETLRKSPRLHGLGRSGASHAAHAKESGEDGEDGR